MLITLDFKLLAQDVQPDLLVSAGGIGSDVGMSSVADADGNVYVTGSFSGTASFNNIELVSAGGLDIFVVKYDAGGAVQWAKRAGGTGDDWGRQIALSGNSVFITGYFSSTINFNTPSSGGSNELTSAGNSDAFVAKYDDTGAFIWSRRAGSAQSDFSYGIGVSDNSVYIVGYFSATANFNTPSQGGSNEITSAGGWDIFLAKYDDTGTFLWAKRAGGTDSDRGLAIAVFQNSIYISGACRNTTNFNNPSAGGSNEIISAGSDDIFVAKYEGTGTFLWAKRAGGVTIDLPSALAVSGNSVYVAGGFQNTANFNDPSAGGSNEIVSAGDFDIFLAKYSSDGALNWAKRAGSEGVDVGLGLTVSENSVLATGYLSTTANFNTPSEGGSNEVTSAGDRDAFIANFDSDGIFHWAKRAGGSGFDRGIGVVVVGDVVYVTGSFETSANFNTPSSGGSNEITSVGLGDMFLARYAPVEEIVKQDQTISFEPLPNKKLTDAPFVLSGTASSGLQVAYVSSNPTVATVNGNIVTINGAGVTTLTALQPGDYVFNPAPNVGQQLVIIDNVPQADDVLPDWLISTGDIGGDGGAGTADDEGNLYVTGYFAGTVTFGQTELTSDGATDIFVCKYSPAGVLQWARRAGGSGSDSGIRLLVSDDAVYVTGYFSVTANFNTPSAGGSNEITSAGDEDAFVAKFSTDGAFHWARRAGGINNDRGHGVGISGNSIYIGGSFSNTANFNTPSAFGSNTKVSSGAKDVFVAKYDELGTLQWVRDAGGVGEDVINSLTVKDNFIYVDGGFSGTADFGPGNLVTSAGGKDIFLACYFDNSAIQWVKRAGGPADDEARQVVCNENSLFVVGYFGLTANFNNPSSGGSNEIISAGGDDIFLARYDLGGTFHWARRAGGLGDDIGTGVALTNNAVFLTGYFRETINFNNPSNFGSNEAVSAGSLDIFFAKFDNSGTFLWSKRAGGTEMDGGLALTVHGNAAYLTGYFHSVANFNNPSNGGSNELTSVGDNDMFLARYAPIISLREEQTISLQLTDKIYGDEPIHIPEFSSSGLPIVYSSTNLHVATVEQNVVTIVGAGTTTITATQDGNDYYYPAEQQQSLTVHRANQTISFGPLPEKTFGDPSFILTATASTGLPIYFESDNPDVAAINGAEIIIVGAGTATITAAQAGDNFFNPAEIEQTLTVHKANQTITFAPLENKAYGDSSFEITASSSSNLPIEFQSSDPSVVTVAGSRVTIAGAGTTTITARQLGNANYHPAENVAHSLVVEKAEQTITFDIIEDKIYGDVFQVTATSSSGLPVEFASSDLDDVTSVSGNTVTIVSVGSATLFASQPGNANYHAAASVDQNFIAHPAPQTIEFTALPVMHYGDAPFDISATSSSGLPVEFISLHPEIASVAGNTVSIHSAGHATIVATQSGNAFYNEAVTQEVLVVSKINQFISFHTLSSKTFGDEPFTIKATSSSGLSPSFLSSDENVATVSGSMVTIIGAGSTTITANQSGNTNIASATPVGQILTVAKANQTLSFDEVPSRSITDGSFQLVATSSSGLDVIFSTADQDVISISGPTVSIIGYGPAKVTASQGGSSNYLPAEAVDHSFCVNPAKPVITSNFSDPDTQLLISSNANNNQWYYNNEPITGATQSSHAVGENGLYQVRTESGTCVSEFSDAVNIIVTAIEDKKSDTRIHLYPNPVSDQLFVSGIKSRSQVLIFSSIGVSQPVKSEWRENDNLRIINTIGLPANVYLLVIQDEQGISTTKFLKE